MSRACVHFGDRSEGGLVPPRYCYRQTLKLKRLEPNAADLGTSIGCLQGWVSPVINRCDDDSDREEQSDY